jgi:methionyl-tRNA formyltransferase
MKNKKIILLVSDCDSSKWLYNAIKKEVNISGVILETPISKNLLFQNRVKKIGFFKVFGQSLFSLLVVPILKVTSKSRKLELIKEFSLDNTEFSGNDIFKVSSINDEECKKILENIQPDIILVNGTRIIGKKILGCTNAIFVNMHVGITPFYRGSHGGYWAIKNKDLPNFGTTLHIVDLGIDTGGILKQVFAIPSRKDNFTTYPILQTGIGIASLIEIMPNLISGDYVIKVVDAKGKLHYQPTIWEYLF